MFNICVLTTAGDLFSDQIAILFFSMKDDTTLLHMHNLTMLKQQTFSIKKCSVFSLGTLHVCGREGMLGYIYANLRFVLLSYS